jgi:hypothetical protein
MAWCAFWRFEGGAGTASNVGREVEQDRRHGEGRMFSDSGPVPGAAANSLRVAAL